MIEVGRVKVNWRRYDDTVNTINEFIAYYEYVMSGDHSEEGWKTKPTTIVKPEVPSVDWEKESSEIMYHSI